MGKILIWWAPFCAGGLCDRILGMVTTYCIAVELGRDFLIDIGNFDTENFPVNPKYRIDHTKINCVEITGMNIDQQTYFENGGTNSWETIDTVVIWSNQNLFYHFCVNRPEINYLEKLKNGFSKVIGDFFLPKIPMKIQTQEYVGIHVRTTDTPSEEYTPYIRKVLLACRGKIREKNWKNIFVSGDCEIVHREALKIFDEENIRFNSGKIIHTAKTFSGEIRVLTDLLSLSNCSTLFLGWNSNFSRIPVLLNPDREFYVYEKGYNSDIFPRNETILEISKYFSNPWWR